MNKTRYIRVLQHDKYNDNIRIGSAFSISDNTPEALDTAEAEIVKLYLNRETLNDSFQKAAEKYYKRVALVDADTLEVLRLIYPKK